VTGNGALETGAHGFLPRATRSERSAPRWYDRAVHVTLLGVILVVAAIFAVAGVLRYLRQALQSTGGSDRTRRGG